MGIQIAIILGVISLSVVILLYMQLSSFNRIGVVKAGNVNDFQWRMVSVDDEIPDIIECEGKEISVKGLKWINIRGESMREYGVHDNYRGFLYPYTKEEKSQIQGMPIVSFKINDHPWRIWESRRKLRRFIAYLPSQKAYDFHAIYEQYKDNISIDKDLFVKECQERMDEIHSNWLFYRNQPLVLSETYDCTKNRNHYSIHRVSSLRGRLDYFYNPSDIVESAAA